MAKIYPTESNCSKGALTGDLVLERLEKDRFSKCAIWLERDCSIAANKIYCETEGGAFRAMHHPEHKRNPQILSQKGVKLSRAVGSGCKPLGHPGRHL
jgi:hypothetical protein